MNKEKEKSVTGHPEEEKAREMQALLEEAKQIEQDLETEEEPDIDADALYQNIIAELKLRGTYQEESSKVDELSKVRKFPKIPKWGKWVAMFCVTLLAVFGISMTSEGNRIYMMQQVDRMLGEEVNVKTNNNEEGRAETLLTEQEAGAEIQKKLGVQVPQFFYKPEGMEYAFYAIEEELGEAYLQYEADGQYLTLGMSNNSLDAAQNFQFDGTVVATIQTNYNQEPIEIQQLKNEEDKDAAYLSQWKYKNNYYYLQGKIGQEDFISMIKEIFY